MVASKIANIRNGDNQHKKEGRPIGLSSTSQADAAKQLNVGERSVKPLLMAKAKENLRAAGGDKTKAPLSNLTKALSDNANTRKQIAEASGVSENTVHKVEKVLASGNESAKNVFTSENDARGSSRIDATA